MSNRYKTDRERDGLTGPVHTIYVEVGMFINGANDLLERQRRFVYFTPYSVDGWRISDLSDDESHFNYSDERVDLIQLLGPDSQSAIKLDLETVGKSERQYDADRNLIQETLYSADGSFALEHCHTYDTEGRKIREELYNSGLCIALCDYDYDFRGNLLTKTLFGENGSLVSLTSYSGYEFDLSGNWIKRVSEISNGDGVSKVKSIVWRNISYYSIPVVANLQAGHALEAF